MELKRVVVTGLGAITPLGNDVPSTWAALLEGVSGAGPITLFDASEFKTQFACQVKDFDPLKYFNAKEARKLDRYTQFALAATQESIADSGLDLETVNKDRAGVIFSAGIGGISTFEQEVGFGQSRFHRIGWSRSCDHRIGCRRIQCHARTLHKK